MNEATHLDPADPRVAAALTQYLTEVLTVCGMDGVSLIDAVSDVDDYRPPFGQFLVILDQQDEVLACAGLRRLEPGVGEVKRMWVSSSVRGQGFGSALLRALEERARDLGYFTLRLDTHEGLTAAMTLYRTHEYREIGAYNNNPDATHFFEKDLRTI